MSTKVYSYQIKAYESQGDWAHGDYVILNQFYIPSENLKYHFHQKFLIISNSNNNNNNNNVNNVNYVEYLKQKNKNKKISYEDEGDTIYNLKEVELKNDFIDKIKQYYELDKKRKELFDELVNSTE